MSRRSSGIKQLFKGLVIGVVLILAIIGSMSILEKDKGNSINTGDETSTVANIPAPSISVESIAPTSTATTDKTIEDTTNNSAVVDKNEDSFKPTLEDEVSLEEKSKANELTVEPDKPEKISFGVLQLSAINPETKQKLEADYTVYDSTETVVAESKSTESASFRLPVGQYKVVTTLSKPSGAARDAKPVQKSKIINILTEVKSNQVFKLEPPPTIGILQVSAQNAKNGQAIKANFIVQTESGETVATRNNVSRSLFKLKAGSYKVTVSSGSNSDFRTIVVEPGESANEVFKLQEAFLLGRVLVRVFDTRSSTPLRADIAIATPAGKIIQELKAVSRSETSLPQGTYIIRVTGANGQSSKQINVSAGQSISEIFRIDAPQDTLQEETVITAVNEPVQQTAPVIILEERQQNSGNDETTAEPESIPTNQSKINLYAKNSTDRVPLKSNFYVQTLNGKNIAKKIYAESAEFELKPGTYKITVRSNNRKNIVKTIRLEAGQKLNEVFLLSQANNQAQTKPPALAPAKPAPVKTIPNGFLAVSMTPSRKTHFIVATKAGKKIVELTSVPSANFKLDTGEYVVTAIYNKQRRSRNVRINNRQTSRVSFRLSDFQTKQPRNNTATPPNSVIKGLLRSRIIDNIGQPLKANLSVLDKRGRIVARANNVSVGIFELPAGPYTIIVNYRGLKGNERVNISAHETTVQTFTISPDNAPPPVQKKSQNIDDYIREKIQREIQKQF